MNTATKLGVGLLALAVGGGVAGAVTLHRHGVLDEVPTGFRVGGRVVNRGAALGDVIAAEQRRRSEQAVTLALPGEFRRVTLAEVGVSVDVAATLAAARQRLDASPGALGWWHLAQAASEGEVDVPLVWRLDEAVAAPFVASLAPSVHRDPQNARLDLMHHERVADVPGAELDPAATIERLRGLGQVSGELVEVAERPVQAAFRIADVVNIDVSKVLATAESTFSLAGTGAGRAVNIATAARKLDGRVIAPGEVFSFNDIVGPRTLEAGFTYAPEIVDEELETGVGGGTCQVSTMVHVAAVNGALEVLTRLGHSRPSAYASMGLDATVIYGQVDLKIRNPFAFPLIIHAYLPKKTQVRVELLGADPQATVKYSYGISKSDDFYRRITYKPELSEGRVVLHQKGVKGHEVTSSIVTTWADGRTSERSYLTHYRPVPEVFWVGRGVDEATLPELAEGVTKVQRRGFKREAQATDTATASPTSG